MFYDTTYRWERYQTMWKCLGSTDILPFALENGPVVPQKFHEISKNKPNRTWNFAKFQLINRNFKKRVESKMKFREILKHCEPVLSRQCKLEQQVWRPKQ